MPVRHGVELGVGLRPPTRRETRVSFQADGLASFLSSISISLDTHGADAVLTRDLTQSAHTAAEIKQALTRKRPQFCLRLVKCLPQNLFGGIFVGSDTRIRGGIVELLVGRTQSQRIQLWKSKHQRARGI